MANQAGPRRAGSTSGSGSRKSRSRRRWQSLEEFDKGLDKAKLDDISEEDPGEEGPPSKREELPELESTSRPERSAPPETPQQHFEQMPE